MPKLHPDRTIRRAQKIIEAHMTKAVDLRVVVPETPDIGSAAEVQEPLVEAPTRVPDSPSASCRSPRRQRRAAAVAQDLLEDFVGVLLLAPGLSEGSDSLWEDVASALPDDLYERLDGWLESALMGTE
jgi:hypothetical protein